MVILSLVYLSLRLDILLNHGDSDVAVLKIKNAFSPDTVLPVRAGDDNFDFRVLVLFWDMDKHDPVE